jgi:glycosyltransferase involved in cell wall biosynthesis
MAPQQQQQQQGISANMETAFGENVQSFKTKKRILIITPVYPPNITIGGGVAVTYGALTTKLESLGHKVEVLSPRLDNLDHGISILYKNFPVIFPTINNIETIVEATERCDVVVCPDDCGLVFYTFIACWKRKPFLFNMHTNVKMVLDLSPELVLRWVAAPCVGAFFKLCSHLSSRTMTTSPSYRDVLVQTGHRCDGVFSPRIKTSVFEQDDSAEDIEKARLWLCGGLEHKVGLPVLIYAGRLSHEKRIKELVAAKPVMTVLAIVGDGPEANMLVTNYHNPEGGVFVHVGMQNQARLRVLYKASDYLVSASKFETLGMTVLESHLCGTPVAVQKAAGFMSQVTEGENGFFIDYDFPEQARADLEKAMLNKPSKEMIAETVKRRWDGDLEELDDVVLNMAEQGRPNDFSWWMWPVIITYFIIYTLMSWPFNTLTDRVVRTPKPVKRRVLGKSEVAIRQRLISHQVRAGRKGASSDVTNHPMVFLFSLCWFWVVIQPVLGQ